MKVEPPIPDEAAEETTGLPGIGSWRAVYGWVLVSFLLWVGLLAALGEIYS